IEIISDLPQFFAGSFLQSGNGDVARGVAIKLNPGAALAIKRKLALQLNAACGQADKAQTATRNRNFAIEPKALSLDTQLLRPVKQTASRGVAHMIKIRGSDFGALQHKTDAVGVAGRHRGNGGFITIPRARIIGFCRSPRAAALIWWLGPSHFAILPDSIFPAPDDPALLLGEML